jgi:hypothetical protein
MTGPSERSPNEISTDIVPRDGEVIRSSPPLKAPSGIAAARQSAPRPSRWMLAAGAAALATAAWATTLLWFAIHRVPWLGPWLADTARAIVGTDAVSRCEEAAYDIDDRWNRWRHRGEMPAARWSVPDSPSAPRGDDACADGPSVGASELSIFVPKDVGPLFRDVAARGDGIWVPVADFAEGDAPVVVYKTLIHPDPERSFAELFVVAVDLRRTSLHAVAGTLEPEASTNEGQHYLRTGLIPDAHRSSLVAAFNGGFKTEHGRYGMKVDDVMLLPPRDQACAIAGFADGRLAIGSWSSIAPRAAEMTWWRQAPACMVEHGELHAGLKSATASSWGTALGGGTVVRRSAIGLDESGRTLYVGVSNATNARALARGMRHVGASSVAQLDINWSYPHIVTFRASPAGAPQGNLLFDGFTYEDSTYLTRRSRRDFFYVTREASDRGTANR